MHPSALTTPARSALVGPSYTPKVAWQASSARSAAHNLPPELTAEQKRERTQKWVETCALQHEACAPAELHASAWEKPQAQHLRDAGGLVTALPKIVLTTASYALAVGMAGASMNVFDVARQHYHYDPAKGTITRKKESLLQMYLTGWALMLDISSAAVSGAALGLCTGACRGYAEGLRAAADNALPGPMRGFFAGEIPETLLSGDGLPDGCSQGDAMGRCAVGRHEPRRPATCCDVET